MNRTWMNLALGLMASRLPQLTAAQPWRDRPVETRRSARIAAAGVPPEQCAAMASMRRAAFTQAAPHA
jgi:hypothetical protein